MSFRPLVLSALCLGLVAGCSRPATPETTPMTDTSKTSAQPEGPSAGTTSAEAAPGQPVVYLVRNSGIRCIAPPCPTHLAVPADKPDTDAIQIHEVDLSEVATTPEQSEQLMAKLDEGPGVKVEAILTQQKNAGPAGDATVLRVKRVVP